MRLISTLILSIFTFLAVFWIWINYPSVRHKSLDFLHSKKLKTLEVRYSAESIMEAHKKQLLKDTEHTFLEPSLMFHPYLLMEVKYSQSPDKTAEGIILWSLVDGEMVINTNLWEKTHGFSDCIKAGADRDDFKIINVLSQNGNFLDRDSLQKCLNAESDSLDVWIETARRKNLIVQTGNFFRLHFQNPKLQVLPETKIDQWLVTKQFKNASCISKKYRSAQIENTARAVFGNNFAIRKTTEIYLPVYSIIVQNPDGSQMTTFWNALNGKKLPQTFYIE